MSRSLNRSARLRFIESLLLRSRQGITVQEIASACNVHRRTIYRDLILLDEAGIPIWQQNNKYGINRDHYLATIRLGFHEAIALYFASRLLARHADEHNPHIVSALHKLATTFPEPLAHLINHTAETIRSQPINNQYVEVLKNISTCWAENRNVLITYLSIHSDSPTARELFPYVIEPSNTGGMYVIGFDSSSQSIRTFKIERITQAQPLESTYTIPSSFELATYLTNAWGIMAGQTTEKVTLRFSPQATPIIKERIWHSSQSLVPLSDGSLEFSVEIADPREMQPWIRSWGAEVEVLEPESLRQVIADDAQRLYQRYHK
jgi:predicted DNA-binding transcriptional regulator YafY